MATLGEQTVGSIVKLNVDGVATNFIVVHQGLPGTMYDSSCNGTWVLMQDIYLKMQYSGGGSTIESAGKHAYKASDAHIYLNNTFINLLDSDILANVKTVKIPYRPGNSKTDTNVSSGSSGLSTRAFLVSHAELGLTDRNAPVEGAALDYFNGMDQAGLISYFEGTATVWWLRTPSLSSFNDAWRITSTGADSGHYCIRKYGIRPAMVLSSDTPVGNDGTVGVSGGEITGSVNIGGVQRELTGSGYINIGGVLRELSDSQVNIGGILKSLKG